MENNAAQAFTTPHISAPSAQRSKRPVTLKRIVLHSWPALLSFAALLVMLHFTPSYDTTPGRVTFLEKFAHNLSHNIDNFYVGIGLILLIIPPLWAVWNGQERKFAAAGLFLLVVPLAIISVVRPEKDAPGKALILVGAIMVAGLLVRTLWRHQNKVLWAWRGLDAIILDFLCVDALGKDIFTGLVRPYSIKPNLPEGRPGFPSGHATMAFIVAWLIWRKYPKLGIVWFTFAALISWSRAEVHAHFPYQVVAGALFGIGLGALITSRKTGVIFPRVLLSDSRLRRLVNDDAIS